MAGARNSKKQALLRSASVLQGKPSRRLWVAALAVSATCVAGLVYALVTERNTPAEQRPEARHAASSGGGFVLGVGIGIGVGVVICSLLATRRKN